jgi:hypothetical protein
MVELRLRVFGNRVLRRIFAPVREEVTGGYRRSHSAKLHDLYSSPHIVTKSRKTRLAEHVARIGAMENSYNPNFIHEEVKSRFAECLLPCS